MTSPVVVPNCDAIARARGALLRPAKIAIGLSTALSDARVEYKKEEVSDEIHPLYILRVARGGFEPPLTVPKTAVLPLDDRAVVI